MGRAPQRGLHSSPGQQRRPCVERGAFVVRSGESTDSLYVLLAGRAKVTNTDEDGREIILAWLGPGEFFGEMGLIDGSPRSANVVAAEACELLFLSKDALQRCLQDNFQVVQKLMKTLVMRLREADRKIVARAETLWVFVDGTGRAADIPPELRSAFTVIEDEQAVLASLRVCAEGAK